MRGLGIAGFASLVLFLLYAGSSPAKIAKSESPEIYIISPADREIVESPVVVKLGIRNANVDSDAVFARSNLVVNLDKGRKLQMPISDAHQQLLLSGGDAETSIGLASGSHTLQVALGDFAEGFSKVTAPVSITVQ